MFQVNAYHDCSYSYETKVYTLFPETPRMVDVSATFATDEQAQAAMKLFPKSVGFKYRGTSISFHLNFTANKATGATNETAHRRWAAFRKHAAKHSLAVEFEKTKSVNSYNSLEAFEQALS